VNGLGILPFVSSFIEGILTFISPCILPLLPVYFFYLAGSSGEAGGNKTGKTRLIANSLGFVTGFTIVFTVLGATATVLGGFLKDHLDILRKVSGVVMVLFGLNFTGIFRLGFLNFEKRLEYKFKELRFFNSIVFGMIFGFGWSPCAGAFLGSALLMAGNSETLLQGIGLLLVYAMGLGVPFILSTLAFDNVRSLFRQLQRHSRIISIISGIVLIIMGILVFFNKLIYIS